MDAKTAARIFHDWAETEGLMPDGPVSPVSSAALEMGLVQPVTDAGKLLLRTKQVKAVSFNEKRGEIIAFLKRAAPTSKKLISQLPAFVDDVPIRYRMGVPSQIGNEPPQPFGGPPFVMRTVAGQEFFTCGSSISVGNFRDAGTLSCLVRDAAGQMFGLSNNHVTGSCSYAGIGLPIVAPGVIDVVPNGLNPFTLGFHAKALPLVAGAADVVDPKGNSDAAIFSIRDEGLVSSFQGNAYDTPGAVDDLIDNMDVEKVGRTTGHTRGRVLGQLHGAFSVSYHATAYGFSGSVPLDPVFAISGAADLFSDSGDSGSLITALDANGQRIAVGIVVAGMADTTAAGGKITIALPIKPILAALQVTLVCGHNI
ncbi:Peptidase S1 domain-containing protein [Sphingomonas antarctica]|uniref:hypothetical protein n=1 Tax=Sphingomonas antarctica TaxID=2040274 RepID=UPI0039EBECD4